MLWNLVLVGLMRTIAPTVFCRKSTICVLLCCLVCGVWSSLFANLNFCVVGLLPVMVSLGDACCERGPQALLSTFHVFLWRGNAHLALGLCRRSMSSDDGC